MTQMRNSNLVTLCQPRSLCSKTKWVPVRLYLEKGQRIAMSKMSTRGKNRLARQAPAPGTEPQNELTCDDTG